MKVQIIEKQKMSKGKPFPKLMKTEQDTVVLFERPDCGTILFSPFDYYNIGQYDEDWVMSEFEDFLDSLTLEND